MYCMFKIIIIIIIIIIIWKNRFYSSQQVLQI